MLTKFKNVSFNAETVTGLEVQGKTLHINTTGIGYEVNYTSGPEALEGLAELTDILNGVKKGTSKAPETRSVLTSILEQVQSNAASVVKLQSLVQSAKGFIDSGKAKAKEEIFTRIMENSPALDKEDIIAKAKDLLAQFDTILPKEDKEEVKEEPKPMATRNAPKAKEEAIPNPSILATDFVFTIPTDQSVQNTKKLTSDEFQEVFGTASEPLIGDMSERQLREFIADFVDGALANERVSQLFQTITEQFSKEEADAAIEGYKNLILNMALQNVEMTLSQVIARFFN